jgi:hypothetical protein
MKLAICSRNQLKLTFVYKRIQKIFRGYTPEPQLKRGGARRGGEGRGWVGGRGGGEGRGGEGRGGEGRGRRRQRYGREGKEG